MKWSDSQVRLIVREIDIVGVSSINEWKMLHSGDSGLKSGGQL